MGGNGARAEYLRGTLGKYMGTRFTQVGDLDGVRVLKVLNQSNTKVPVEAFSSNMYYVVNTRTNLINHIVFYDKNKNIAHSIDLEFNSDGSIKPYREFIRKGKVHSEGTHFHKSWRQDDRGDNGRISHDSSNIQTVNKYYMRFVNKAVNYNNKLLRNHGKEG